MNRRSTKDTQREIWGALASHHDRILDPLLQPVVEAILERACLWPGESVLDVGTATGSTGLAAAGRVGDQGEVFGIDLTSEMVTLARQRASDLGVKTFQIEEGDVEALPYGSDTFDVILSNLTYMHCPDPGQAFREAYRVLKTPGRLVMAAWGRPERCAIRLVHQVLSDFPPAIPEIPSPFSLSDIDTLWDHLYDAGFRPAVEALEVTFEYRDLDHLFQAHAFLTHSQLDEDERHRAKQALAGKLGRTAGPFRLTNEIVFAIGYR